MATSATTTCPIAHQCGGCARIETPYAQQLADKQRCIEELFAPLLSSALDAAHSASAAGHSVGTPDDAGSVGVPGSVQEHESADAGIPSGARADATTHAAARADATTHADACTCTPADAGNYADICTRTPADARGHADTRTSVVRPIMGMDDPREYRTKIVSPFAPSGKKLSLRSLARTGRTGRVALRKSDIACGLYAAGTHRIVECESCPVEMPVGRRVVAAVRDIMARYGMAPYDEDAQRGFVRHVVVRVGAQTGEVLATIVTNGHEFAGAKNFCRELLKRVPEVTTVVQNVNTRSTNAIFGTEEHVLYGPGFILDTLCGLSFRISSNSFFQVNARQTQVLYQVAVDFAFEPVDKALDAPHGAEATNAPRSPHASDTPQAVDPLHAPHSSSPADATATIVDAYCGTGTIGLVVAAAMPGAQIIGVDKTASAIADARQNAAHNGIDNAQFVAQDAGEFLSAYAAVGNTVDIVLMDPPRAGASEDFLRSLAHLAPRRIVYISCNPETQARDCKALAEAGYVLHAVQPVDMFPHTEHVECVALLSKAK